MEASIGALERRLIGRPSCLSLTSQALAAISGFTCQRDPPDPDRDHRQRYGPSRRLDAASHDRCPIEKATWPWTRIPNWLSDGLHFRLSKKNYDDLRDGRLRGCLTIILVVFQRLRRPQVQANAGVDCDAEPDWPSPMQGLDWSAPKLLRDALQKLPADRRAAIGLRAEARPPRADRRQYDLHLMNGGGARAREIITGTLMSL